MTADRFDALTRGIFAPASRRRTLGVFLAGMLAPLAGTTRFAHAPDLLAAQRKHQRRRKRQKHRRKRKHPHCFPGTNCQPGPDADNEGCDFDHRDFIELDARGANFRHANLTEAELPYADLRGTDLSGACLVGANLAEALIDETTKLDGAIFCRTLMPDKSWNNRDCDAGTRCCPAPFRCEGDLCPATCIGAPNAPCSYNVPYGGCCPELRCVFSSTNPAKSTCQAPCGNDVICHRYGANWHCAFEPVTCRYIGGQCCQHI